MGLAWFNRLASCGDSRQQGFDAGGGPFRSPFVVSLSNHSWAFDKLKPNGEVRFYPNNDKALDAGRFGTVRSGRPRARVSSHSR